MSRAKSPYGPLAHLLSLLLCSHLIHGATNTRIGLLLPPDTPGRQSLLLAANLTTTLPLNPPLPTADLIVRGRIGQWGDDGTEAARLALDDAVLGLITPPDGTASHLVLQVAGRTGVPTITLCPDTSVVGAGIPWSLQVIPDTQKQALTILKEIRNHHPPPWIAIVPEGRAGREISNDLARVTTTIHHPTPVVLALPANPDSYTNLVQQALHPKPTAILLWLDTKPAAKLASLLRQQGYSGILAGPLNLQSPEFTGTAGPHATGFLLPAWSPSSSQTLTSFSTLYTSQAGTPPTPADLLAADAGILLRTSLTPATTPGRVQLPDNLSGLSGPLTFEASGRRMLPLHLIRWQSDSWQPLNSSPGPQH